MDNCKTAVVIPSRMASTRFPGKPLALLGGKPMVQWVYEKGKASKADAVIVATDDETIKKAVEDFGGVAVMTSPDHPSGTDRISEAVQGSDYELIINVQGDEPLIPSSVIDELIDVMRRHPEIEMGTVAVPRPRRELDGDYNKVKVVFGADNLAMYFSRSMIPYLREGGEDAQGYLHWGIYAFRRQALERFVKLPEGRLEKCEKLEQLRALENGIRIYVLVSNLESIGIDTPEDLALAEAKIKEMK